jgi:hypothetical protein
MPTASASTSMISLIALAREHGAGRGEAEVHQHDQHERQAGAVHAELGTARDHLRNPHARALRGVQRHHDATADVADQQADDRPQRVVAEHDGQRTIDDRSDLQVGAEPERELIERRPVPLRVGDVLDRASLDRDGHRAAPPSHARS